MPSSKDQYPMDSLLVVYGIVTGYEGPVGEMVRDSKVPHASRMLGALAEIGILTVGRVRIEGRWRRSANSYTWTGRKPDAKMCRDVLSKIRKDYANSKALRLSSLVKKEAPAVTPTEMFLKAPPTIGMGVMDVMLRIERKLDTLLTSYGLPLV